MNTEIIQQIQKWVEKRRGLKQRKQKQQQQTHVQIQLLFHTSFCNPELSGCCHHAPFLHHTQLFEKRGSTQYLPCSNARHFFLNHVAFRYRDDDTDRRTDRGEHYGSLALLLDVFERLGDCASYLYDIQQPKQPRIQCRVRLHRFPLLLLLLLASFFCIGSNFKEF